MEAWIHFNESDRNPVWISCALKKNLPRCIYISSTPISLGLRSSPTVDSPPLNILMSLSVLRFVLTFFISAVSVYCMLPRLSCLLTCHNDVINAGQNNRLFAAGTDMDRALLRLLHIQKGTYYVQICDKRVLRVRLQPNNRYFLFFLFIFLLVMGLKACLPLSVIS